MTTLTALALTTSTTLAATTPTIPTTASAVSAVLTSTPRKVSTIELLDGGDYGLCCNLDRIIRVGLDERGVMR